MTDAAAPRRGFYAGRAIVAVMVVAVVAALAFALAQRQATLRASAVGLDGLAIWLRAEGIDARSFAGGWPLVEEEVGLLVVPLYDTDLGAERAPPRTQEELLLQQDEYDLSLGPIREKARTVPTLVVLPKWRSGVRLTELAHPTLLVERARVERLGGSLVEGDFALDHGRTPFTGVTHAGGDGGGPRAALYAAQTFAAPACRPVLGSAEAMVLGDCPLAGGGGEARVHVLSDPDLLNNHGLALGDNAFLARDVVAGLKREGDVVIDYSRRSWFAGEAVRSERERTWADLLRFFSPPFTAIWAGGALAFALMLWRSGLRFGPALPSVGPGRASRTMAIAARARLMQLSGRSGPLARQYAQARLAATAARLFGPGQAGRLSAPEAFLAHAQGRHPDRAGPLAEAMAAIAALPDTATPHHAMSAIEALDGTLEHMTHDTQVFARPR